MAAATAQVKTCSYCQRCLPITEFRRRWKGRPERHSQCRPCNTQEARARCKAKKAGRVYEFAKSIINAKRSRNEVVALTSELLRHFGGTEQLAATWKSSFDRASAAGRNLVVSKLLIAIVELHIVSQELAAEQQKDLEELSDEELQDLAEQQRLALAIKLAGNHG